MNRTLRPSLPTGAGLILAGGAAAAADAPKSEPAHEPQETQSSGGKPALSGAELQAEAIRISKLLRCPASPNHTLFESEAAIANELKGRIFVMLREGKTSDEIIRWMVERYGEQISYMPEMNAGTAALWIAPWAALAAAGGLVFWRMRRTKEKHAKKASDA